MIYIQGKGLLAGLLGVVVVMVVMGSAIPVLWPVASNSTAINAMSGTDAGTTTIKSFWPIILLIIGIGLAVGLIVMALRKFGLLGGTFVMLPITAIQVEMFLSILLATGIVISIGMFISQIRKIKRFYATKFLV